MWSEKAMASHSSTLAWRIPGMEDPGGQQSMGLLRVRHDWATSLSLFTFMHWRRKWQPTPVFLPGESRGRGSLMGCVYGVTRSWTWLKQLSSSSSSGVMRALGPTEQEQVVGCSYWGPTVDREMWAFLVQFHFYISLILLTPCDFKKWGTIQEVRAVSL